MVSDHLVSLAVRDTAKETYLSDYDSKISMSRGREEIGKQADNIRGH